MNESLDQLLVKATAGDSMAQRELAVRYHEGKGVQRNPDAAEHWLRKAASAGDTWSQTTLGIVLRSAQSPEKQRESIAWLEKAAGQDDDRAKLNLGLQQLLGLGIAQDIIAGLAHLFSLGSTGNFDAKSVVDNWKANHPLAPDVLAAAVRTAKWPMLHFFLGPPTADYLQRPFLEFQAAFLGKRDPTQLISEHEWFGYERQIAETSFKPGASEKCALLAMAFGRDIYVRRVLVAPSAMRGSAVTTITISIGDLITEDGWPVYWKPTDEGMNAAMASIGLVAGRNWVEWAFG